MRIVIAMILSLFATAAFAQPFDGCSVTERDIKLYFKQLRLECKALPTIDERRECREEVADAKEAALEDWRYYCGPGAGHGPAPTLETLRGIPAKK